MVIFFNTVAIIFVILDNAAGATTFNLEEQMHLLKEKYEQVEAKVIRLEAQVKNYEILAEKLAQLELVLMKNEPNSNFVSRSVEKKAVPRTCREGRANDPSLPSGMYCDMIKDRDSESPTDVGHCTDPGCYSRAINYNASNRQMTALAQLSSECHQSIKYDCIFAPLELNDVAFCWWNDRSGNSKYFWSGGNTDVHTCQCGIDGNCVETFVKCNCDAAAPIQLSDDGKNIYDAGVITDKDILPITRLNFGRTQLETSSGVYTLGRFECTGQTAVNGIPGSCEDLWRIGHTNGLYSIMGVDMVESVYCDFARLPNEPGFQTWIGFNDVQSSPTYFYVQKNSSFSQFDTPVPFEIEKLNTGGAMNLKTGTFIAPRKGTYFFSFSGIAYFPGSTVRQGFRMNLYLNGQAIGDGYEDEVASTSSFGAFNTIHTTLALQAGDKVWVQIAGISEGVSLHDGINHFTHFIGWLLREDISQSLVL
ncbi:hypothetical protein OUZ56_027449 [Daphnia magna]|uniref:C1q domain-containing protein n=1 Tax=Daphnia magna TaxID=35525 RepID=A0ABQ9ZQH0_9CRUS|nr:hypothetical protein OUZ56_027449 [Daphnia magna]